MCDTDRTSPWLTKAHVDSFLGILGADTLPWLEKEHFFSQNAYFLLRSLCLGLVNKTMRQLLCSVLNILLQCFNQFPRVHGLLMPLLFDPGTLITPFSPLNSALLSFHSWEMLHCEKQPYGQNNTFKTPACAQSTWRGLCWARLLIDHGLCYAHVIQYFYLTLFNP